jgi:hypothetical protein
MSRISWSVQQAIGITDAEARNAEVRASRIEEAHRPDGASEYVPVTDAYASRGLYGRNALRRLGAKMPEDWNK